MKQLTQIEKAYLSKKIPDFRAGDTVKVHVKIKEGDKERVQVFQGTVISRRGSGTGETFTVRKVSAGIGVERIFPLHSPNISKIQRSRRGKVRRAKLYYLRGLTGKSARIEELLDEKAENEKAAEKAKTAKGKKAKKAKAKTKADKTEEAKAAAEKPTKPEAEEAKAEESKAEETKAEEAKVDEAKAEETKSDEAETEKSKE